MGIYIDIAAALWLLWTGAAIKTENLISALIFQFIPLSLSFALFFGAIAHIEGWPL